MQPALPQTVISLSIKLAASSWRLGMMCPFTSIVMLGCGVVPTYWREGLAITQIQQVWVGDITFLETEEGFCYLSLLTDAYSCCIVGYDLSTSLSVEGAKRALDMAIAQAAFPLTGLIHHSDHGS